MPNARKTPNSKTVKTQSRKAQHGLITPVCKLLNAPARRSKLSKPYNP